MYPTERQLRRMVQPNTLLTPRKERPDRLLTGIHRLLRERVFSPDGLGFCAGRGDCALCMLDRSFCARPLHMRGHFAFGIARAFGQQPVFSLGFRAIQVALVPGSTEMPGTSRVASVSATGRVAKKTKGADAQFPGGIGLETPLGWIGLFYGQTGLADLILGGDRPEQLWQHAHRQTGKADGLDPPDWCWELAERLRAYSQGVRVELSSFPLAHTPSTPFQQEVVRLCRAIPWGETLSYGELAKLAGVPGGARAVGNVMRVNRTPLVVPCHRVIASGKKWGGFSAQDGVATKIRLLTMEGVQLTNLTSSTVQSHPVV